MVCVAGEGQGVLEIVDLVGGGGVGGVGGDEQEKKTLKIPQSVRVAELVLRVSHLYKYKIGSVGLMLLWNRNKVDLMNVRRDLTIADIGVDFSSGTAYRLLITEWQPSPSMGDEQKMPCADGGGPSVILEVLDLTTGDFAHTNLEIGPATRVNGLFRLIERNHKPGTFGLFLRCGRNKVKLNDKDTRKLTEVGVDLSSPGTVMLLVTEPSDSPTTTPPKEEGGGRIRPNPMDFFDEAPPTIRRFDSAIRNNKCMMRFEDEAPDNAESDRIEEQGNEFVEFVEPNRRSENAYVGLVNQAMTCYLNSLIQALYMTPEFRNALYNWEYVNDPGKDEANSIPYQLQKLFLNLQTSSKNAIETTSLTKSFGWDSTEAWQQHDIQELCRVMFDALEQKFKNTEQADLINRLYEGKMIDYVKCLECGTEKSREDTFLDIPLPVRPFGSNVAYNSVEEALNAFVQPETLDDTNQYHCEKCNKKCDAHKGLKFTKFPYLLTLHLKRFDFDYNTFHRIKLNDEVTFPDVLNLNSFIPSSETAAADSPCNEEDAGVGVKCDEAMTTDNCVAATDEKCPPTETPENNGTSVYDNHSTNHDQDDDSGIDLSNGPSTSSCGAHNHDNEKNRDNWDNRAAAPSGPYEYELFSIMIHSGSASGGHYYAYIKDFRTGLWLCFNDQNVSSITYDDIQKTYGGGPTRAYYSGVYSSSTNAYMLMYRQIDPARNALPMQVKDFPKHLQDLLLKMQGNQNASCRKNLPPMYRLKVIRQQDGQKKHTTFTCPDTESWGAVTRRAHMHLCKQGEIPKHRVRLVTYDEDTETIDSSFDGREAEPLRAILDDRRTLLLEVREPHETFKTYMAGGVPVKVLIVDPAKKEVVSGPMMIPIRPSQTVAEFKSQLRSRRRVKDDESLANILPKDINIIVLYSNGLEPKLVKNDESTLREEHFENSEKIIVPTSFDHESPNEVARAIDDIIEVFGELMTLNFHLPDASEETLQKLNIPSLAEKIKEKAAAAAAAAETPLTNGPSKTSTVVETATDGEKLPETATTNDVAATPAPKAAAAAAPQGANAEEFASPTVWGEMTSPPGIVETQTEDWYTPEQSNSEDSSLSYSDRTLVGEDDASEDDDDYPLASVEPTDANPSSTDENWEIDADEYYFQATPQPDRMLEVLVDGRMCLGTLKKLLEPFVGVPMEYFRTRSRRFKSETDCTHLSVPLKSPHKDGAVLFLTLGRALRDNEIKLSLYQLLLPLDEPFRYLCEWIVSKDATVGQVKKEILAELRKKFDIYIAFSRCRLRQKDEKAATKVFLDDQKIRDLNLYHPYHVIVQALQEKEPVTDTNDVVIFTRRLWMSPVRVDPYDEIVVRPGKSLADVRQQLSQMSQIPEEYLEWAKGKSSLPSDLTLLVHHNGLDWYRQPTTPDNWSDFSLEDGMILYYRDWREKVHEPSAEEVQDMKSKTKSRMLGISSSSRYSPRRERALKIYIDDK